MSPASTKLQAECPTAMRRTNDLELLVCLSCDDNHWALEDGHVLRCLSCRAALPIDTNIVDCIQQGGTLNGMATQWNAFYQESLKPYSVAEDWWTVRCWRKHLFGSIIQDLPGKLIIDFGCGTAARVSALAPVETHAYHYIGIDSSLDALKCATQAVPGAFFIHADLGSVRLKPERADIALCLGVLMYFQEFTQPLGKLLNGLKPGGILLLHEQIRRKRWTQTVRTVAASREISPSSFGIQYKELLKYLLEQGSVIRVHFAGSPLRRLSQKVFDNSPLKRFRPLAAWIDSLWCATVGRIFPSMGPSEIQVVFRKRGGSTLATLA